MSRLQPGRRHQGWIWALAVVPLLLTPPLAFAGNDKDKDKDHDEKPRGLRHRVVVLERMVADLKEPPVAQVSVDCDAGDLLQEAIDRQSPGSPLTVEVKGTCQENVIIENDQVSVLGTPAATIAALEAGRPALAVSGAQGVVLENLTLTGGAQGLLASSGSGVALSGVLATANSAEGLRFENGASATLANSGATENGNDGIAALTGAALNASGALDCSRNTNEGMDIDRTASFQGSGAAITCDDNGRDGIQVNIGASYTVLFSTVSASGNGRTGVAAAQSATCFVFFAALEVSANVIGVSIGRNAVVEILSSSLQIPASIEYGLFLSTGGRFIADQGAVVLIDGAGPAAAGILLVDNAAVHAFGNGSEISVDNSAGHGIFADRNATVSAAVGGRLNVRNSGLDGIRMQGSSVLIADFGGVIDVSGSGATDIVVEDSLRRGAAITPP